MVLVAAKTGFKSNAINRSITFIWFSYVVVIGLANLIIIGNAIRLTVFARRQEIEIMRLVGASNWFIRAPFLIEGVIQGSFSLNGNCYTRDCIRLDALSSDNDFPEFGVDHLFCRIDPTLFTFSFLRNCTWFFRKFTISEEISCMKYWIFLISLALVQATNTEFSELESKLKKQSNEFITLRQKIENGEKRLGELDVQQVQFVFASRT